MHMPKNSGTNMKKIKYKSADEKRKVLEAERYREEMYKRWGISEQKRKPSTKNFSPNYSHRSTDNRIGSVDMHGGTCSKKNSPQYTGTLITGIAVMHKSCLQPVISKEQAIESAQMRRN